MVGLTYNSCHVTCLAHALNELCPLLKGAEHFFLNKNSLKQLHLNKQIKEISGLQ